MADLERQNINCDNHEFAFAIDPASRNQLPNGRNNVDSTDSYEDKIAAFTIADRLRRPWAEPVKE